MVFLQPASRVLTNYLDMTETQGPNTHRRVQKLLQAVQKGRPAFQGGFYYDAPVGVPEASTSKPLSALDTTRTRTDGDVAPRTLFSFTR